MGVRGLLSVSFRTCADKGETLAIVRCLFNVEPKVSGEFRALAALRSADLRKHAAARVSERCRRDFERRL